MKIIDVVQGSEEWLSIRTKHNTASEASAMMAASKNTTRNELLHMKATGSEKEFSDFVQKRIIDKGHEIEEMARPIAEAILGDELYPVTVLDDDGYLLASLDGMTMDERTIWECKSWNREKAEIVEAGNVPLEDYWQVIHQLKASGASECLYMVTDGTEENEKHVIINGNEGDFSKLIEGWHIFDQDVLNYSPREAAPEIVPEAIESLPAIRYELNGLVLTSNLEQYKFAAKQLIEDAKKKLETDQDFADATVRIKSFAEAESKLKRVRDSVLGEIDDVDRFCRDLAEIGESIRQARLSSEKQVQHRKKEIRNEILLNGKIALAEHIGKINKTLGIVALPDYAVDFAAAMKGKRSIDSLIGSVDDALAKAKLDLNQMADEMRVNISAYQQVIEAGLESEFRDLQQIITKPADDFKMIVIMRIDAAKKREEELVLQLKAEDEQKRKEAQAGKENYVASPVNIDTYREPIRQDQGSQPKAVVIPSKSEIIGVLVRHFRTDEDTVTDWLNDYFAAF